MELNPRVWVDAAGDPWIEIEPGRAAWINPWLRQQIKDKVGLEVLSELPDDVGLRLMVPQEGEQGEESGNPRS